jgi:hypothetical protein
VLSAALDFEGARVVMARAKVLLRARSRDKIVTIRAGRPGPFTQSGRRARLSPPGWLSARTPARRIRLTPAPLVGSS